MSGRIKVVFASLLKPVDEPRMYSKLARSLSQTNKYDINIIGFRSKNIPDDPAVTFWPLFDFPRISLSRLLAPLHFLRKLLQLKPKLIILTSPDFLLVTCAYKILFGCSIIYDVQENYYRNIIWSHSNTSTLRILRAKLIRLKEKICDRIIIQYTLAEHCYATECSFISKPFLVLENKASKPVAMPVVKDSSGVVIRLLFSGTIAESYGVFDALHVADAVYTIHPQLAFVVVGHCPSAQVYDKLVREAENRPWMVLKISSTPIPHPEILKELQAAHFTFVAYRLNPSNEGCVPTRIWEALAWKTPIIMRKEHPWVPYILQHQAGFAVDFLKPDKDVLKEMLLRKQYYTVGLPDSIYWESIEGEWIELVESICSLARS